MTTAEDILGPPYEAMLHVQSANEDIQELNRHLMSEHEVTRDELIAMSFHDRRFHHTEEHDREMEARWASVEELGLV